MFVFGILLGIIIGLSIGVSTGVWITDDRNKELKHLRKELVKANERDIKDGHY